ncbi:yippee zinc-binding/DNA-binding /Mis18, centromere assembly-domain-containing protein [Cercophora samala]|uniref:Yippee zinc-binding/DNA-binding /Mis18, centromere assembly-domain-containing protein n=1 Tax=Cercophora samala TaxID=330535 RepID=A0AA39ZKE9_9PEZI|nr:yippee zinc-binding/DNA-binding /Mis18, centromere assembly-domain-containing protein [Cercophora samala]
MFGELIALNRSPPSSSQAHSSFLKFPRYLVPSISFTLRRRKYSPESRLPRLNNRLTRASPPLIRCLSCRSDLAFHTQIVSKGFHGRHGKALLVSPTVTSYHDGSAHEQSPPSSHVGLNNIQLGPTEKRQLATGPHEVADIFCAICETKLGWKYVKADEPSQKYKVGKFILEVVRVVVEPGLEFEPMLELKTGNGKRAACSVDRAGAEGVTDVVFDSDDEDECEDLFNGVWNAEDVAARRKLDVGLARGHA